MDDVVRYWSRTPGKFVDKLTGVSIQSHPFIPTFTGCISEWYQTLVETIADVSEAIGVNRYNRFEPVSLVMGSHVASILECTVSFRAAPPSTDPAVLIKIGTLSNRYDVYVNIMVEPTLSLVTVSSTTRVGHIKVMDLNVL